MILIDLGKSGGWEEVWLIMVESCDRFISLELKFENVRMRPFQVGLVFMRIDCVTNY